MKYKVGDRVRIKKDAIVGLYPENRGKVCTIKEIVDNEYCRMEEGGVWFEEELELVEKTLDNLEVGDVLINDAGNKKTVLKKESGYIMSCYDDQTEKDDHFNIGELERGGFKIFNGDTIEIEGKKYRKEDVIDRVKKLKEVK